MDEEVKKRRRRGTSTISAKHQVTLPEEALEKAGLRAGDRVRVEAGRGSILLVREADPIETHAGSLTDIYERGELGSLRAEWD